VNRLPALAELGVNTLLICGVYCIIEHLWEILMGYFYVWSASN